MACTPVAALCCASTSCSGTGSASFKGRASLVRWERCELLFRSWPPSERWEPLSSRVSFAGCAALRLRGVCGAASAVTDWSCAISAGMPWPRGICGAAPSVAADCSRDV
eukprot:scaffold234203_cov23-Tisochrysis_lutea.AAC.1